MVAQRGTLDPREGNHKHPFAFPAVLLTNANGKVQWQKIESNHSVDTITLGEARSSEVFSVILCNHASTRKAADGKLRVELLKAGFLAAEVYS